MPGSVEARSIPGIPPLAGEMKYDLRNRLKRIPGALQIGLTSKILARRAIESCYVHP
jgi:hypothetical protein